MARDGTIEASNPKLLELLGWSAADLIGQRIEVLLPDALREQHVDRRERFVKRPQDRPMGVGLDLVARHRDGSTIPVEVSLSPWESESEGLRVICSVRDIRAHRRLRNFSEGALRASEEERQRIARELHDDTAQRLATLILRVRMLAHEPDDHRRSRLLDQVRQEIVDAADGVKRMARGLRPPEIEELGLEMAVRAHIRTLRESGIFDVDLEATSVDEHLDDTAKLALYRIIQESLSNARRHSGVDRASVHLGVEGGNVVVEVSDRGSGMRTSPQVSADGGLGLVGMEERATMIGGRILIDSTPSEGTRVRVTVPVDTGERLDG